MGRLRLASAVSEAGAARMMELLYGFGPMMIWTPLIFAGLVAGFMPTISNPYEKLSLHPCELASGPYCNVIPGGNWTSAFSERWIVRPDARSTSATVSANRCPSPSLTDTSNSISHGSANLKWPINFARCSSLNRRSWSFSWSSSSLRLASSVACCSLSNVVSSVRVGRSGAY